MALGVGLISVLLFTVEAGPVVAGTELRSLDRGLERTVRQRDPAVPGAAPDPAGGDSRASNDPISSLIRFQDPMRGSGDRCRRVWAASRDRRSLGGDGLQDVDAGRSTGGQDTGEHAGEHGHEHSEGELACGDDQPERELVL
jgi:hypothetical protein